MVFVLPIKYCEIVEEVSDDVDYFGGGFICDRSFVDECLLDDVDQVSVL